MRDYGNPVGDFEPVSFAEIDSTLAFVQRSTIGKMDDLFQGGLH